MSNGSLLEGGALIIRSGALIRAFTVISKVAGYTAYNFTPFALIGLQVFLSHSDWLVMLFALNGG